MGLASLRLIGFDFSLSTISNALQLKFLAHDVTLKTQRFSRLKVFGGLRYLRFECRNLALQSCCLLIVASVRVGLCSLGRLRL